MRKFIFRIEKILHPKKILRIKKFASKSKRKKFWVKFWSVKKFVKSKKKPTAPGEALAEEVGSRGWLGEYLDRVATSASSLSGRWSERLSQGRHSHSLRHDDSWRRDPAAAAAKSATPAAVAAPGEEALAGEHRDRDNLAPFASSSSLSGRWSQGHRRDESWRWSQGSGLRGREGARLRGRKGSGGRRGVGSGEARDPDPS